MFNDWREKINGKSEDLFIAYQDEDKYNFDEKLVVCRWWLKHDPKVRASLLSVFSSVASLIIVIGFLGAGHLPSAQNITSMATVKGLFQITMCIMVMFSILYQYIGALFVLIQVLKIGLAFDVVNVFLSIVNVVLIVGPETSIDQNQTISPIMVSDTISAPKLLACVLAYAALCFDVIYVAALLTCEDYMRMIQSRKRLQAFAALGQLRSLCQTRSQKNRSQELIHESAMLTALSDDVFLHDITTLSKNAV